MNTPHKIEALVKKAQESMSGSNDPIHDLRHVRRVVQNAEKLGQDFSLSENEQQALTLAAWWHDVGRTITRKPSMIWMVFFDDLISAVLLWRATIQSGLFGSVAGMATRLIFCKSVGTGSLLTKILLGKKTRILLDILKDADNLDLIHIERFQAALKLSQISTKNEMAFRLLVWINTQSTMIRFKTTHALKYFEQILRELIQWVKQQDIVEWFLENFGKKWVEKTLRNLQKLFYTITVYNSHASSSFNG